MEQTISREEQTSAAAINQFLTFAVGAEEYGIELLKVQEIKGYSTITPIPNTPAHVKGVLNLRGSVVPVMELRARFGMEQIEYTKFNVIIVVNINDKIVGLLVDAVSDVLNVRPDEIKPAPDFGSSTDTRFISGIASSGEKIVVLLDLQALASDIDSVVNGAVQ